MLQRMPLSGGLLRMSVLGLRVPSRSKEEAK
jgi:hypothetical protein